MNIRDKILAAKDFKLEEMYIPEWEETIYIRTLSGEDQDTIESGRLNKDGSVNMVHVRARYAALVVCDKDGNRIFEDKDIPAISKKSGAVLNRILEKAAKLNQLDVGEIEDLAKN